MRDQGINYMLIDRSLPISGPVSEESQRSRKKKLLWTLLILFAITAFLLVTFIRLPYFAFRPGSVNALSTRVIVTQGERFEPKGEIYFTTVRQDSTVNGWEFIRGSFDDSVLIIDEKAVLGDRDRDENMQLNMDLMRASKSAAEAVALSYLGFESRKATGVGMALVDGPAKNLLTTDDVITAVAGKKVFDVNDLVTEIRLYKPGDQVIFDVEGIDGENSRKVTIKLGSRDDDSEAAFLGIAPQTRYEDIEDLPVDVQVNTGKIGGNSAGLALTLAIIDVLTPGELTGGVRVATTGTIDLNGQVGPIGGIVQKVIAARDADIDLFLVPLDELSQALPHAGSMRVEGVADLEGALVVLAEMGGNAENLLFPTFTELGAKDS